MSPIASIAMPMCPYNNDLDLLQQDMRIAECFDREHQVLRLLKEMATGCKNEETGILAIREHVTQLIKINFFDSTGAGLAQNVMTRLSGLGLVISEWIPEYNQEFSNEVISYINAYLQKTEFLKQLSINDPLTSLSKIYDLYVKVKTNINDNDLYPKITEIMELVDNVMYFFYSTRIVIPLTQQSLIELHDYVSKLESELPPEYYTAIARLKEYRHYKSDLLVYFEELKNWIASKRERYKTKQSNGPNVGKSRSRPEEES